MSRQGPEAPVRPDLARYRRRRRAATWVLLALGLVGLVVGGRELLLRSPRFALSAVTVTGASEVAATTVRAASGLRAGVPLLTVDLAAAQRGVATIPSVAGVRAVRRWPDTVEIRVTERTPVALAASVTGSRLVDRTGMAYRSAGERPPPLPRLAATRVAPGDPATEAGLAVLAALPATVRGQLQVVEAAGPRWVILRLAGGKQVRWGTAEQSERKAAVLAVLMSQSADVYDVSAPDLPTVRR
ncbi:MAG: cell division protein FtsQ/DivIB [Pseudonocardia sp.]